MRYNSFEVVIEKEAEDDGYLAYSPTLPGCFSDGLTIEDAKRNIRAAMEQHLAVLLEHGLSIPQHGQLAGNGKPGTPTGFSSS